MKKIIVIVFVLLVLGGCSKKVQTNSDIVVEENDIGYEITDRQITLSYTINDVQKEKLKDGTYRITANGMNNTYDEVPLPYISYVLALPIHTDVDKVLAQDSSNVQVMDNIKVGTLGLSTTGDSDNKKDQQGKCKTIVTVQSFQGIKVAYITIYPFIYDEEKRSLSWLKEGSVLISLKEVVWDLSRLESYDAIKRYVDNLEMIGTYEMYLNSEE